MILYLLREVASVTYIECTIRTLDNVNPEKPIARLRAFDAWQLLSVIQAIQNTLHVACHKQAEGVEWRRERDSNPRNLSAQ